MVDYHTAPSDESGNLTGWVAHAGTGPVDMAILVTELHDGQRCTFMGPVSSYFECTSTSFYRLTDEEWKNTYLEQSLRPEWVNIYLADKQGETKGAGLSLITDVENEYQIENQIPKSQIIAQNYPNPFNASTIISFKVPYEVSGKLTEITVYDIQGRKIKSILKEELPSGNYLTRWKGKNESGIKVSSGVYIYKINIGNISFVGKMNLMK